MMETERRRAAFRLGLGAEARAAWLLRLKGYRVLDRRFRCPAGEIDLVVRRGRLVAFVEVKARADLAAAAEAVTPRSRRRIVRAAETWMARRPQLASCDMRFDVVLVTRRLLPQHVPGAFTADF